MKCENKVEIPCRYDIFIVSRLWQTESNRLTAFKTISMRIRGAKTEMEDLGMDTEGMVDSTAKLRSEIMALTGVDIMDGANQFKSTYKIMDELAAKWKDLTDIQQATVTELIAGKRQGNIVSSLMNNFDIAEKALETSLNSSGSAMREHEKWQQSLEAQILKLKASWQSLSQAFLSSDFLKVAFDGVINLVDGLTKLIDTFGAFPTLVGAFTGGLSLFKNKGLFTFDKDTKSIQLLGNSLDGLKGNFTKIQTAVNTYNSNLSKSTGLQNAYVKTLSRYNGGLGKYLQNLNGAKASMGGYIASLVGAKVASFALQAATVAMNAALTMGISFLISAGISAIQKWINAKEELAEKVDEVTSKFKEQHTELVKNKSSFEAQATRYSQLAKGVNEVGENVSLTVDEYAEYQDIVNSIADQVPSLIQGYDAQGNAILNYKGNVEELTAAYEDLIKKQNDSILKGDSYKDIEKDFKNAMEDAKSADAGFMKTKASIKEINALEALLSSNDLDSLIPKINEKYGANFNYLISELENAGIDKMKVGESSHEFIKRAITQNKDIVRRVVDDFNANLDAEAEGMRTAAQAALSKAFDFSDSEYKDISDNTQALIRQVVGNFDAEQFDKILESGKTVEEYINDMLDSFENMSSGEAKELEAAFDLQTKFNGGDISYGEYIQGIKNAEKLINDLNIDDEIKNQIKLTLDTKEIQNEYDALKKRLTSEEFGIKMSTEEAEEFLDGLTASEYSVFVDLVAKGEIDLSDFDIESFRKYLEKEAELLDALNYTISIDVEAESIEALNTAMAESVSGAGLSSEAIAALKSRYAELEDEGYNLSAMFEETANGIHLNREAVSKLEQKLASDKLVETDKQLGVLKNRYDELTTEIDKCRDAGDRASLYTEQQSIVDKINDLATLAAQYKGLTSAYNAWLATEEAGSERDMYEGIIEGFETVGDEISRGWVDDGTIKFLELLTGKSGLAGKSGKELKKIYDDLDDTIKNTTYSIRDFFTVDEDGNSTNTGVYNFLDAIGQLEEEKFGGKDVVKRDKDGNIIGFDFELVAKKDENGNVIKNGDQVIAEALGISEELVQIMVRASDDAGFVVNLEGAYTQLADLKTEAESARDTLISLQNKGLKELKGVDVNFNLEAEGNDLVKEQKEAVELLNKFKDKNGKIDLEMEGAQQALDIAEYLTIKLDDLTEPKIMQIDVSEVDEDLRDPIEKMQEIVKLSKEKNLVSLTGDKKEIKEVQSEINKVAEELEGLDPEIKAKVGIDDNWDSKTIADKIEKGEIEIPASLELDVQMSDDLKDMRLMMMNQLGLVSDNEVKLKVGFDVDESMVDGLTDEQKEVVVKFIAENEDEFNKYTEEEKETVVKLIANGVDLEKYEVEDKEAIVNYIANGEEADGWTPEAKDAFVKYLADGGEIDKFDPENKDSWVVYDTDTTKPDGYEADDEDATVVYDKDSSEPDGYVPDDPNATVIFDKDTSAVDSWKPVVTGIAKFTLSMIIPQGIRTALKAIGISIADGTANVDGSSFADGTATKLKLSNKSGRAFKQGDWRTKKTETALTGELGRELVVTGNRWYTVGDSGAEFATIPKGSIVFNHKQTEELFKNGKVTSGGGRGKSLASGTAFSGGSGGGLGVTTTKTTKTKETTTTTTTSTGSSGSGGGIGKASGKSVGSGSKSTSTSSSTSSSSSSSAKEDFKETIDWIEIAISRIEREIDNLDKKASNIYTSWYSRNATLVSEIDKVGDEIALQQNAYDRYIKEANSVGLSSSWAKKVRNGKVDISTIKDEALAEKIKDYETWYNKALDCQDAILELKETESELYAQRFENIQTQYDGILQGYEHTEAMLNEYIAQAEEKGYVVSKKYYQALIDNEKSNIAELKKEQADLIAERDNAVAEGKIVKGSEAWYEQCAAIDEVTQSIEEGSTAVLEYARAIEEIDWSIFDLIQERISDVSEEADFLIELMSNKKLFEDDGKLTSQGLATMGLHAQNYNTHMYAADEYGAEVAKLNKQIANDPYDQELINRRNELIELQRESILAAEDEKNAIRDLVEEGINLELDALQELIDKKNEELESERDLYEYSKKVKEQTKEIADIEKMLSSYSGDDSEEAKAKIQELKVSLEEAETDLQETEWDRYIDQQSQILDTLYNEYELILNTRLDNIDYLLEQVIETINLATSADGNIATALGSDGAIAIAVSDNAASIKDTLASETNKVGITLSNAMNSIWSVGEGNAKSVLTMYGEDFRTKSTTIITTLNGIKTDIAAMVDDVDKDAQKKTTANKTTTSAKKNPTTSSSSSKKPTTTTKKPATTSSSGDGKPKVGDKVKFVSGQYYYDSQGTRPLGYHNRGKEVYITSINTKSWATHPYHISTGNKLGKGDLGWLKLNQLSGYAVGKQNFLSDEVAWTQENGKEFIVRPSDGAILTPIAKGDSVLTSAASSNIWDMANSPAEFIKDNLGIGSADVPNNSNVNNEIVQHFENITFSLPNVHGYNDLLTEMQRDPKFEKLILSMTIDQIAGKSKLVKGKSIR